MDSFITSGNPISPDSLSNTLPNETPEPLLIKDLLEDTPVELDCNGIPIGFVDTPFTFQDKPRQTFNNFGKTLVKKFKTYKSLCSFCNITSIVSFLSIFVWACFVEKNHIFIIFIVLAVVLGIALKFITFKISNKFTNYYSNEIIQKEFVNQFPDAHFENMNEFSHPGLNLTDSPEIHDFIAEENYPHLITSLNLGGTSWNKGAVSDAITANLNGVRFRTFFSGVEYQYTTSSGKNRTYHHTDFFKGQLFIVPAKIQTPCNRIFIPVNKDVDCNKLSDYFKIFKSYRYSTVIDLFTPHTDVVNRIPTIKETDATRDYPTSPYNRTLEPPEFMECMLKLHKQLKEIRWEVRILNGFFILITSNAFNFNFERGEIIEMKLSNLHNEFSKMYSIIDIITKYAK